MQHLDLTALRYFSETAACGSIRLASDRLHVTPSAVSRQIAKLEHRLSTVLFERRASGVVLTPAGRLLFEEMGGVYRHLSRVQNMIADLDGLRRGEVTIHCMEGAVESWLPAVLKPFHERHPAISFRIAAVNTDRAVEALIAGDCDIAVTFKTQRRQEIAVVKRRVEALVALVAPGHQLAGRRQIALAELLRGPLVMPDVSFGVRQVLERTAKRASLVVDCLVNTNSVALARSVARQGMAATVLPPLSAYHEVALGQLHALTITGAPGLRAEIQLCVRRDHVMTTAAEAVKQELAASFDALFEAAA